MKKIYALLAVFVLTLSSCDDFLDVNRDPNNPQFIPLENRLVGAITMTNGASMWRGAREIAAVVQYAASGSAQNNPETWRFTASYFFWQNAHS